jgi:hypothetical protein
VGKVLVFLLGKRVLGLSLGGKGSSLPIGQESSRSVGWEKVLDFLLDGGSRIVGSERVLEYILGESSRTAVC